MVSPGFPPMLGGGEQYCRELSLALHKRGHQIQVVSSNARQEADFWRGNPASRSPITSADEGLTVTRCPARGLVGGRPALLAWRKGMVVLSQLGLSESALSRMAARIPPIADLDATLDAQQPDVIHAFNLSWEGPMMAARRLSRRLGAPLVLTPFTHLGNGPGDRVALNSTMTHQLAALRAADAVLALTSVEAEQLADLGIAPDRIHTVGGGLVPPSPPPDAEERARILEQLRVETPYALFIGRVTRDKGALDCMAAIEQSFRSGITLALVGAFSPEARRAHARLSPAARERVRLLGAVDERIKQTLLAETEMLLLPSRVESFGIVLLEAWHHGKPVVAARAGGLPGVVHDGENGLMVPPGDIGALATAIERLLSDQPLAHRLGQNGRAGLVDYAWPAVAERVESAYRAALAACRDRH